MKMPNHQFFLISFIKFIFTGKFPLSAILLTGCAGFIGSHVAERLLNQNYKVIGIDNFDAFYKNSIKRKNLEYSLAHQNFQFHELDITDAEALKKIETPVDAVIHLAAKAGVLPSIKDPVGYTRVNINGTQNILDWILERKVKKLVFASSSSVYGNSKQIPFKESVTMDMPISPYAYTKRSCELLNHVYHHLYGIDILNLRFFTVYGPRQRPDLAIHKFVELIQKGEPVTMYGDGSTARDYTFVEDTVSGVVNALQYVIQNEQVFDTVNLGNNQPVPLKELIDTLYELMGAKPNIKKMPMQPGDVDITYADISKAQSLFNYQPKKKFKEGLKDFIEWYQAQA